MRLTSGGSIDGLYVGGSTGEAFVQSLAEERAGTHKDCRRRRRENHADRPCRDGKRRRKPAACQRRKSVTVLMRSLR
ncbi:hypothetical protein KCP78_16365 [Salmonella enterica subsp. enterica]|nr:hypothetical protein KCP78_16365 [Salmonella enterica subsp. enterica]